MNCSVIREFNSETVVCRIDHVTDMTYVTRGKKIHNEGSVDRLIKPDGKPMISCIQHATYVISRQVNGSFKSKTRLLSY